VLAALEPEVLKADVLQNWKSKKGSCTRSDGFWVSRRYRTFGGAEQAGIGGCGRADKRSKISRILKAAGAEYQGIL
jgi:hypothetical protein